MPAKYDLFDHLGTAWDTLGRDPEDRFYLAGEDEPWDPYRDGRSLEVRADYCGCGEPMTFMEAS